MTRLFMTDAYDAKPRTRRQEIEASIASLRTQLWSDPGDKREIEGVIEEAEAQLRALNKGGGCAMSDTVRNARKATDKNLSVEKRTGRDGRTRRIYAGGVS